MANHQFTVPVSDLEKTGHKSVTWPLTTEWLDAVLGGTDARSTGTVGALQVELSKNGAEVVVRGRARAQVELPCARSLEPAIYDLEPEIFLLLSPASQPDKVRPNDRTRRSKVKPAGSKRKRAGSWAEDPPLNEELAAEDTFSGDQIVLDDFVREFLLLELPMFPLRSDLRSLPDKAIGAPPADGPAQPEDVDPRLAPLAEVKRRLTGNKE